MTMTTTTTTTTTTLVATEEALQKAVSRLVGAKRLGVDVESNGLFKYRATLCTMQIANEESGEVVVIDTIALATMLAPLETLLGPNGPRKIVHDVAFDARILAETGLVLANVLDTSIAARMLSRTATGLASLLESELGIKVDKKLQHHDWTERPIRAEHLRYLAGDVAHLGKLADRLMLEIDKLGIADEIEEETNYRLSQSRAAAGTVDPRPPWVRLKGVDRAPAVELPILRRLAELREVNARNLDVPPYKVLGPDVLFAIAQARPATLDDLAKIKGASGGHRARALAPLLLDAVAKGLAETIPETERVLLDKPRKPQAFVKARRGREGRLTAWRKAEAKRRGVDEQVVLPGHCLQDLADLEDPATLEQIAAIPGIGAFRATRDGPSLLAALATPRGPSPTPTELVTAIDAATEAAPTSEPDLGVDHTDSTRDVEVKPS